MGQADKFKEAFREEAKELLTELETGLLELEETPDDLEVVGRVFRAMHTIKGSGAMFGFDRITAFTHEVETAFDKVRNGELKVTKELIGTTLAARDLIRAMLDSAADEDADLEAGAAEVVRVLRLLLPGASPPEVTAAPAELPEARPAPAGEAARPVTYRIRFRPKPGLFRSGGDPMGLFRELAELGHCKVVACTRDIPRLGDLDPEVCHAYWDVILTTDRGVDAIRDVFIFVENECALRVEVIDDSADLDSDANYKRLGEILVERGDLSRADLEVVLRAQKPIGEVLKENGLIHQDSLTSALTEQKIVREARAKREPGEGSSSLRVPAEKLDSLVDLVGELVIAQARLAQIAGSREDAELISIAEEIERLSAELRDNTLNVRMLPIGTTFSKFRRLVRDLSAELGKQIELVTEGAETELDKTVIERLGDPLVHLIRNSIDHGIEPPEGRRAAGKPERGLVRLSAYHSGPNVVIEIADDGVGLDPEALRAKALEKGLIGADAKLSEKELWGLIFLPGFSTAKSVSSVSGRGVGMDVVKRSIDALSGTVEIESRRGEGARIRIKLPLTLAIIEGLLVSVGAGSFVLPLSLVEECVELSRADVLASHGRQIANVRGELVPYIRLREWFATDGEAPPIEQIVIAGVDGARFGFVVDSVVGQHQTVIKTLGKMYREVEGLSGATILGDGTVALILDAPKLVESVTANEVRH
ncbi:MAG: chemotaxis protein CheA [Deltaproteobacteria bacterium]|nr:chemotaxis protein CheA [Deltaproteobacteria bacterium]